jgi:hypothetical protein
MLTFLLGLALVLVVVGAVQAGRFVWIYAHPPFDWRTYEAGRHLMQFTRGIAVILVWSLASLVLRYLVNPDPFWLEVALSIGRVVIFGYVAWMMTDRLHLLLRSRQEDRPNRKEVSES